MIAKTLITSKGFGETCSYLCQDQTRAQVLAAEGVRTHDLGLMAADFEWQHELMPDKEKPVYHSVLSFPAEELVEDERLVELGKRFLEKVEVVNTQYVFVKHTDKDHLHIHILANKVDNDGEPTGKGLIIQRGIRAAQELTGEYGLHPDGGKRLDRTHREALSQADIRRYHIYEAIREVLPQCRGLGDMEKQLLEKGITVKYRRDEETGERQGISFRWDQWSFKGSRVDPEFSLSGLQRTLALQEERRLADLERLREEESRQAKEQQREEYLTPRHGLRHKM